MRINYQKLEEFTAHNIEEIIRAKGEELGGMGAVVHPVRVAVSGISEGPGLFEMLELLGQNRVCERCRKAATIATE